MLALALPVPGHEAGNSLELIIDNMLEDIGELEDISFRTGVTGIAWCLNRCCEATGDKYDVAGFLADMDDQLYQRLVYVYPQQDAYLHDLLGNAIYFQQRETAGITRNEHYLRSLYKNISLVLIIDRLHDYFIHKTASDLIQQESTAHMETGQIMLFLSWYLQNNFNIGKAEDLLYHLVSVIESCFERHYNGNEPVSLAIYYYLTAIRYKQSVWEKNGAAIIDRLFEVHHKGDTGICGNNFFLLHTVHQYSKGKTAQDAAVPDGSKWILTDIVVECSIIEQFFLN
jgi:hypothetical protein